MLKSRKERRMKEYIFEIKYELYNEDTGEVTMLPKHVGELIRCNDCRFYNEENLQCMIHMNDETEWYDNDYCSFAERKEE